MLFNTSLNEINFPHEGAGATALAPIDETRFVGFWDATLFFIDEESVVPVCPVSLPHENDEAWNGRHLSRRFHVSPDGRFVVLCHDFGRYGLVVDLEQKHVTMQLDRGDYHPETQPFSATFFHAQGHDLLVHASKWNRLEISDPATGELLTPRDAMVYEANNHPAHYLDYFHGALLASPDGQWIADDGWIWAPVGIVTTWSLGKWRGENMYESEDGASRRELCWRDYLWNIPVAWIDSEHLAFWGLGEDDEDMANGARIFNVSTGEESATFEGPSKTAFFGGDGRLFSVEDDGLHIWDANLGERLGRIDGFKPKWQRGDFLIELKDSLVRSWNWCAAFD